MAALGCERIDDPRQFVGERHRRQLEARSPALALEHLPSPTAQRVIVAYRMMQHVWTAPRVKGFLEALRSFRVRTCLRPVGAEKITPLALMRNPLWFLAPISLTRSYRRRAKSGLRNLSVRSHHPLVTLNAFSPCSETSSCRALLAQATTGRSS